VDHDLLTRVRLLGRLALGIEDAAEAPARGLEHQGGALVATSTISASFSGVATRVIARTLE
jgi:hypothetical protein